MEKKLQELKLEEFLKEKTLYYDKIDFSVVNKAWEILSKKIKLPFVIHIVGTNGKGSTGRFLAHYLYKKSFKTLHYSSPHIQKFNERIWINGNDVDDLSLENAHDCLKKLYSLDLLKKLTFFEYTTLLALYLAKDMDYLVLEAGLGGEFDATNVIKNDISLITTIDLDHQAFLGNSIEQIASTKMRSVDKKMIIGYQVHPEIEDIAHKVKKEIKEKRERNIEIITLKNFDKYSLPNSFALYLKRNLHLAIACLKELNIDIDTKLFEDVKLFGRCQKIASNITIDVGHNPLAAKVLVQEFKNKKVTLIYNSYKDKDYEEVLKILKPIIKEIYLLEVNDKRMADKNNLSKIIKQLNIMLIDELKIEDDKEYLAFGSFMLIEKFLLMLGLNEK